MILEYSTVFLYEGKVLLNKMIKYHQKKFNPLKLNKNNIDRMAVEKVPGFSFVLDIGCATGFIGEYLIKQKNCKVIGIEKNKKEGELAEKRLTKVMILDIETLNAFTKIKKTVKNKKFDVIYATSLIEHLKEPGIFLQSIKNVIKPNGKIIISTPNISHWTIIKELLKGEFRYKEYGILDETHLHFFTIKSLKSLLIENGYKIEEIKIDRVGGGYPKLSKLFYNILPNLCLLY